MNEAKIPWLTMAAMRIGYVGALVRVKLQKIATGESAKCPRFGGQFGDKNACPRIFEKD